MLLVTVAVGVYNVQ